MQETYFPRRSFTLYFAVTRGSYFFPNSGIIPIVSGSVCAYTV